YYQQQQLVDGWRRRRASPAFTLRAETISSLEGTLDRIPDAAHPSTCRRSSAGYTWHLRCLYRLVGDFFEQLHVSERCWPGHPIRNKSVLLLIVTHRPLGARAKLPISVDTKFILQLPDRIPARALLEKNKFIKTHRQERIGPG